MTEYVWPAPETGAAGLTTALRSLGFADWFEAAAGDAFSHDPWVAFDRAQRWVGHCSQPLGAAAALFVHGGDIERIEAEQALGSSAISWLSRHGVLRAEGSRLRSAYCLISRPGLGLFANWPLRTAAGRLVCQQTYLSAGSYDCANAILDLGRGRRALDLGCGGGILTATLARLYDETVAIDVDPLAIWLTELNLALNGAQARVVHGDWTDGLKEAGKYDLIVSNPPWRIVPAGVRYPDAVARVGQGADGLDQVRRVLGIAVGALALGGKAILRFDVPHRHSGGHPLQDTLEVLADAGISAEFQSLGYIGIDEQAQTSANACAHLNGDIGDLRGRFLENYAQRGITRLESVLCHLTARF
ncbi:MAG: methyltransferase [Sphingomonas sp.]